MSTDAVGTFRNDEAEGRFLSLLRSAMAGWPAHRDGAVGTSFGRTAFSATERRGDRTPLVLLQGGSSTVSMWAGLADEWCGDRQIVAIDTLWEAGRGAQQQPMPSRAEAVDWLDETLSGIGCGRVHLLGYSYGGWLALEYAAARSERLHSATAIEPPIALTGMPLGAWWRMIQMMIGGARAFRSYLSWVRGGGLPSDEALELLVSAQTDFVRRGSPRPRRLTGADLKKITVPLMIVLGGESKLVPARAATTVSECSPRAEVHVIPNAGHVVPTDAPAMVTGLVRSFLLHVDDEADPLQAPGRTDP